MIDLHSHVLFGLDDGARTLEDSLAIARAAAASGVEVLAATPHVRDDYPTSADQMLERLAEVQAALGSELELVPGGELSLEEAARLDDGELRRFTLGGGDALLLEFPYSGWPLELGAQLFSLQARGFRTVLAHPERNAEVASRPARLRPLVEAGALVQVTAGSLAGGLGRSAREAGRELLRLGLVHLAASDAHSPEGRSQLGTVAESVGEPALARWLTTDAPLAVLRGGQLPAAPPSRPARRRLSLRRR